MPEVVWGAAGSRDRGVGRRGVSSRWGTAWACSVRVRAARSVHGHGRAGVVANNFRNQRARGGAGKGRVRRYD